MKHFTDWQEGDITATEALRFLCQDLDQVEQKIEELTRYRDQYRKALEHIVETQDGQKAVIPGFGRLEVTHGSTTVSYPRKELETIISRMTAAGDEFAIELAQLRTESHRAGTLRITRDKVAT